VAVQGNEYVLEFCYTYRPIDGPQVRPEHPTCNRPRLYQYEFKRIGVRVKDGREFLTRSI
jgi:hypothetical protein